MLALLVRSSRTQRALVRQAALAGLQAQAAWELASPDRQASTSGRGSPAPGAPWRPTQRCIFSLASDDDLAKKYNEKKLIGFSPNQMFDVVSAVEQYSEFVPWCQRSTILRRESPESLEAELEVGFQAFVERYTSKVTLRSPSLVRSRAERSALFQHLYFEWELRPGPTPGTTWVAFEVDFAFRSRLYHQLAGVFLEEVVQRMMGAFEARCTEIYGPSSLLRPPCTARPGKPSGNGGGAPQRR